MGSSCETCVSAWLGRSATRRTRRDVDARALMPPALRLRREPTDTWAQLGASREKLAPQVNERRLARRAKAPLGIEKSRARAAAAAAAAAASTATASDAVWDLPAASRSESRSGAGLVSSTVAVPLAGGHAIHRATIPFPMVLIALERETCDRIGSQLHAIAPKLVCVIATRFADVRTNNGTATVATNGAGAAAGSFEVDDETTARVLYHYPPVHSETYNVGVREVAILLSHLRAVAAGREMLRREGRRETRRGGGHFLVIEEDAELGLLLSSRHDWLQAVLAALPTKWTMLQAAVIAELPWLKHLHKRLSSARRPYVSRNSLRGLSWPFSPPRVVWANTSWVKPYWSAAAYLLSQRGANELLHRYWPEAPRLRGVTIDTRSQLWPAADQLIFNMSAAFLSAPLLTQPVEGAHAEHSSFKQDARDFVFRTWLPQWGRLHETRRVLASVYAIGGVGTEAGASSEWHASGTRPSAAVRGQGGLDGSAANTSTNHGCNEGNLAGQSAWLPCLRMAELPTHVHIAPAPVFGRAQEAASSVLERWITETHADRARSNKPRKKAAQHPTNSRTIWIRQTT